MVPAWIFCFISESIAKFVLWIVIVARVQENLCMWFSQSDVFRISDIQEDLYKFGQGTLGVSNYFA